MDKADLMSIDTALDEGHFKGAVAYKKVATSEYVLVYQHPQKSGVFFGTRKVHCYEFELACLGFRPHTGHRRPNGQAPANDNEHGRTVHLLPARPRRFSQELPSEPERDVSGAQRRVRP